MSSFPAGEILHTKGSRVSHLLRRATQNDRMQDAGGWGGWKFRESSDSASENPLDSSPQHPLCVVSGRKLPLPQGRREGALLMGLTSLPSPLQMMTA